MSKDVLVVDTSAGVRHAIRHLLEDRGYSVSEADGSHDALRYLEGRTVQMIICDAHLPSMDGVAFVNSVRQRPAHRTVPTLMLSADEGQCTGEGGAPGAAAAWMQKPFLPSVLLQAVDSLSGGPCFGAAA